MKKRINNFFVIYTMVFVEVITIGKLFISRFSGHDITGQLCSQTFFLRLGHVNLVRNLLESKNLYLCLGNQSSPMDRFNSGD